MQFHDPHTLDPHTLGDDDLHAYIIALGWTVAVGEEPTPRRLASALAAARRVRDGRARAAKALRARLAF